MNMDEHGTSIELLSNFTRLNLGLSHAARSPIIDEMKTSAPGCCSIPGNSCWANHAPYNFSAVLFELNDAPRGCFRMMSECRLESSQTTRTVCQLVKALPRKLVSMVLRRSFADRVCLRWSERLPEVGCA